MVAYMYPPATHLRNTYKVSAHKHFRLNRLAALILSVFSCSTYAIDITRELVDPGEYSDVNINITSASYIDAIRPLKNSANPNHSQSVILNGKTDIKADGNAIIGMRIVDQGSGSNNYQISLIANDDVTMNLKGRSNVYGMLNGANYGFGSPDSTYSQGKIEINGALNLTGVWVCVDFCVQGGFQGGSQSRLSFVYRGLKITDQRPRETLSRRQKCAKRHAEGSIIPCIIPSRWQSTHRRVEQTAAWLMTPVAGTRHGQVLQVHPQDQ